MNRIDYDSPFGVNDDDDVENQNKQQIDPIPNAMLDNIHIHLGFSGLSSDSDSLSGTINWHKWHENSFCNFRNISMVLLAGGRSFGKRGHRNFYSGRMFMFRLTQKRGEEQMGWRGNRIIILYR